MRGAGGGGGGAGRWGGRAGGGGGGGGRGWWRRGGRGGGGAGRRGARGAAAAGWWADRGGDLTVGETAGGGDLQKAALGALVPPAVECQREDRVGLEKARGVGVAHRRGGRRGRRLPRGL